jgi:hypothetical protein
VDNRDLLEYFVDVWDERLFPTARYPIHAVCGDAQVSLPAIQVLVNRHAEAPLAVMDHDQQPGLLPIHLDATGGASLEIVFYLLRQCPDALLSFHGPRNATSSATTTVGPCPYLGITGGSTNAKVREATIINDTYNQHVRYDLDARGGPAKKKGRISFS